MKALKKGVDVAISCLKLRLGDLPSHIVSMVQPHDRLRQPYLSRSLVAGLHVQSLSFIGHAKVVRNATALPAITNTHQQCKRAAKSLGIYGQDITICY
jgi:hypothetical protein